jgi:hypothetical protein
MAQQGNSSNAFPAAIRRLAAIAGEMSVMPDADQQFVQQIQQLIAQEAQKIQQAADPTMQKMQAAQQIDPSLAAAMQQQMQPPQQDQGIPPQILQALMAQSGQGQGGMGQPGPMPGQGFTAGGSIPNNPDELRRILQGGAGQ